MRILIIHNYYQHKGGEDVVFQQEVDALRNHHQVETVTFQNQKGLKGLLQFALYPWNIFAAHKILRKAKDFSPDIIHFHNLHYAIGPWALRTLYKAGFKVVQTLHNHRLLDPSATLFANNAIFLDSIDKEFPWQSIRLKTLDNSYIKTFWTAWTYYLHKKLNTWKNVDRYLVFSNFMKDLVLKSSISIHDKQIALKPNAIASTINPAITRKNIFVYIGRLSIEKGIDSLLKAFTSQKEFTLEIYGDGPLVNEVNRVASIHKNIVYYGFQQKDILNKALAEAKALIVPSICFEGMPMTVIEAYAAGTPVLSSKIGVLQEMIIDNYTGFHFEANNPRSIIASLQRWSTLTSLQKQEFSDHCVQEYTTKYQLDLNMRKLEDIYQKTIAEK